jgi:hypothetical protein
LPFGARSRGSVEERPLHTRKVAGSIPAGTTGHQCRSGPFRCPDFRSIAHNLAADKRRIVPGARLAAEPVERIRHTIQVGVLEIGVSVRRDHDRGVAHRHLQEIQIGASRSRQRGVGVSEVVLMPMSA